MCSQCMFAARHDHIIVVSITTRFYTEKKSSAQDKKTKLVESRKKVLEKMERIEDPDKTDDASPIQFYFPEPAGMVADKTDG